jgi:hypothetical protein
MPDLPTVDSFLDPHVGEAHDADAPGPHYASAAEPASAETCDHLEAFRPSEDSGLLGRGIETGLHQGLGFLPRGAHVDVSTLVNGGPVFAAGGATVRRTEDGHYEVTLASRAGPGIGAGGHGAAGVAMAAAGVSATLQFDTREGLVRALSAVAQCSARASADGNALARTVLALTEDSDLPSRLREAAGHATRGSILIQEDAFAVADLLPLEAKAALSGKQELAYDSKTGEIVQRAELNATGEGALAMQKQLAGIMRENLAGMATDAVVKVSSDSSALIAGTSLAVERRYKGVGDLAGRLQRAEIGAAEAARQLATLKAEPLQVVGKVTLSAMGTEITATQSMPLSEVAGDFTGFLDPRRADYHVEGYLNGSITVGGQLPDVGLKVVVAKTRPVYQAAHVSPGDLPQRIRESQDALRRAVGPALP